MTHKHILDIKDILTALGKCMTVSFTYKSNSQSFN